MELGTGKSEILSDRAHEKNMHEEALRLARKLQAKVPVKVGRSVATKVNFKTHLVDAIRISEDVSSLSIPSDQALRLY